MTWFVQFRFLCIFLTVFAAAAKLTGSPVPTTTGAEPTESQRRRVSELSRRSADLIEQRKFADAKGTLEEALFLIPDNPTCLYDLACVDAATGRPEKAISDLEHATDAGFTDFSQLERNPAFAVLRDIPGYRRLLSQKDEITHRAATRILGELKHRFGDRYSCMVDEQRKMVFAAYLAPAALDELASALRVERASQGEQVFSHPPDEFIRIVVASAVDFSKIELRSEVAGYYDDSTRTLIVKHTGPELRHEFTHAMHAADQHALDQEHPVWLSEGLATLYEYATSEAGNEEHTPRLIPADTWRLASVQAAAKHDTLIPIDKLVTMDRAAFTSRADLAYGESGSLLLYLYEHQLLKKFYEAYTEGFANDPTGLKAMELVTGMSLPRLQKDWMSWLTPRSVPSKQTEGVTR
jgi:hypothetical protein